jgi:DNA repair protein RadD
MVVDARKAFADGARSVLCVLPTGGGKTVIGADMVGKAVAAGRRVLWLAHRRELIHQAASRFMGVGAVGVFLSGSFISSAAPIQVASVQTITAREARIPADIVFIDEAHHVNAKTFRNIIDQYPDKPVVGFTATPQRSDGAALGDVFEAMVMGPQIGALTDEGFLVRCEVFGPKQQHDGLAEDPVESWLKRAGRRQGFIFTRTVEQSKKICERLDGAVHVDGSTPAFKREGYIKAFQRGAIRALSSVYVFTEGVDLPMAEVCMLARGCGHVGTYLQMVGRVLRTREGKSKATLIDLTGVAHKLGLPDQDRLWSLKGKAVRDAEGVEPAKQCLRCQGVFPPFKVCPGCGYETEALEPPKVKAVEVVDLRTCLRPEATQRDKKASLLKWRRQQLENGYKIGWVSYKFKSTFGHWPDRETLRWLSKTTNTRRWSRLKLRR